MIKLPSKKSILVRKETFPIGADQFILRSLISCESKLLDIFREAKARHENSIPTRIIRFILLGIKSKLLPKRMSIKRLRFYFFVATIKFGGLLYPYLNLIGFSFPTTAALKSACPREAKSGMGCV